DEMSEGRVHLCLVVGRLAAHHSIERAITLLAHLLHELLAGTGSVGLRQDGGGTDRDGGGKSERNAKHEISPFGMDKKTPETRHRDNWTAGYWPTHAQHRPSLRYSFDKTACDENFHGNMNTQRSLTGCAGVAPLREKPIPAPALPACRPGGSGKRATARRSP